MKTVLVSGGFDPLHVGHLDLIKAANKLGEVLVALNSDDWLLHKKGYVFTPWEDRRRLLLALKLIIAVVPVSDSDGTVSAALRELKPDIFANGGDRKSANPKEATTCVAFGIKQMFNVGGAKIASSGDLVREASLMHQNRKIKRVSFS